MYLLTKIETNDIRTSILVSNRKSKIAAKLAFMGFHWSRVVKRYITNIANGNIDYIIEKIDEI